MTVAIITSVCVAIGRGDATLGVAGRLFLAVMGVACVIGAFSSATQLRGAFGKGPGVPLGSAGRVILCLMALVMFHAALRG
jgi:hypothetical protein